MARHSTQNGQKCCDDHVSFKTTVHKGYNLPYSMIITQIARRRARHRPRRIRVPFDFFRFHFSSFLGIHGAGVCHTVQRARVAASKMAGC